MENLENYAYENYADGTVNQFNTVFSTCQYKNLVLSIIYLPGFHSSKMAPKVLSQVSS